MTLIAKDFKEQVKFPGFENVENEKFLEIYNDHEWIVIEPYPRWIAQNKELVQLIESDETWDKILQPYLYNESYHEMIHILKILIKKEIESFEKELRRVPEIIEIIE
ncbi:13650_t:CDS:1 [Acaulospora colombiana]|uniref:13650_t:CDS:1 n=1 Tax=Acaulospora colombiana TaxID=27376 RepID=A0ACA9P4L9_9GLOM|nr:13650_t:CDS:1 [Acaulospora colombiana]